MRLRTFIVVVLVLLFPGTGYGALKRSVSENFPALLEKLPYEAERPFAREIRYIYASALELKGKAKDPFVVTNEPEGYEKRTTPRTDWSSILDQQAFDQQAQSMDQSNRAFLDKYDDRMSVEETESYLAMNRSVQTSIAALQTYFAVMDGLAAFARASAHKEANSLVSWTESTTKCIGDEAPEGSILHLEIMWLTKGQSFKLHSASDISVIATLETGDGRMISSYQIMQKWIDTKKTIVSPEGALLMYETIPEEKKKLLSPLLEKHGILPLEAVLINAAIEDLYLRLEALEDRENLEE